MFRIILYAVVFAVCTIFWQWILFKVRKNHNKGRFAIWVGTDAIIVLCVVGLITKDINYFAAVLGFLVGDEVGKQAGWH